MDSCDNVPPKFTWCVQTYQEEAEEQKEMRKIWKIWKYALGSFQDETTKDSCKDCGKGKYQANLGKSSCEDCGVGRWAGQTLIVETVGLHPLHAERHHVAALSKRALVIEKFTRISEVEMLYEFEVEDPIYYTENWSGEMIFTANGGRNSLAKLLA